MEILSLCLFSISGLTCLQLSHTMSIVVVLVKEMNLVVHKVNVRVECQRGLKQISAALSRSSNQSIRQNPFDENTSYLIQSTVTLIDRLFDSYDLLISIHVSLLTLGSVMALIPGLGWTYGLSQSSTSSRFLIGFFLITLASGFSTAVSTGLIRVKLTIGFSGGLSGSLKSNSNNITKEYSAKLSRST